MKYLKRFNESMDDPTYEEITRSEWDSIVENRIRLVDTKYPEIIKKFITDNGHDGNNARFAVTQLGKRIIIESSVFRGFKESWDIGIDICPDEWFLVHITGNSVLSIGDQPHTFPFRGSYQYYKCDQLDGLLDCLKNIVKW